MAEPDIETKAIGEIAGIVGALEEEQRGRVIRYILERFNITGPRTSTKGDTSGGGRQQTRGHTLRI